MANNKTNSFEEAVLKNWFNNDPITGMGNAGGVLPSSVDGNLYIALFASPVVDADLEAGSFTDECSGANYTGYARVPVARTTSGWTVTGSVVKNANTVGFPQSSGGTAVVTHAAVCKSLTGTTSTDMIIWGALQNTWTITNGVTPQFATDNIIFTEQ